MQNRERAKLGWFSGIFTSAIIAYVALRSPRTEDDPRPVTREPEPRHAVTLVSGVADLVSRVERSSTAIEDIEAVRTVRVRVVAAESLEPIPGASIYAWSADGTEDLARADANGVAVLLTDRLANTERIGAYACDYAPAEEVIDRTELREFEIQLHAVGELRGQVVDWNGRVVEGVRVLAIPSGSWPSLERIHAIESSTTSDPYYPTTKSRSDGTFEFDHVARGQMCAILAIGGGYVSATIEHRVAGVDDSGSPPDPITVHALYGVRLTAESERGDPLPQVGDAWRTPGPSLAEIVDEGLTRLPASLLAILAGASPEEVRRDGGVNGVTMRMAPRDVQQCGPLEFVVHQPGFERVAGSAPLQRVRDAIPEQRIHLTELPSTRFGRLEVRIVKGGVFDPRSIAHRQRQGVGSLYLECADGTAPGSVDQYPLRCLVDAPQVFVDVPIGTYRAWVEWEGQLRWPENPKETRLVQVTQGGGSLDVDFSSYSSLEVELHDRSGRRIEFDAQVCVMLTRKDRPGRTAFSIGQAPYVVPIVPPGDYEASIRLDSASALGPRFTVVRCPTPFHTEAGLSHRVVLSLEN